MSRQSRIPQVERKPDVAFEAARDVDCKQQQHMIKDQKGNGTLLSKIKMALHQNSLHGTIPNELTNYTELRALDLSSNSLKGDIPFSIDRLSHLQIMNLSTNFFSGEILDIGVLSTFDKNSTGVRLPIGVPMLNSSAKDQSLSQSPGSSQYSEKDKFFYKVEVKSLA
eukprot:XP_014634262.1 LRR receptor-like serine/threonine-protein kinase FEI 2 [Glycine max]